MSELSDAPEVITQKPSFIVFMEGGDKDEQVLFFILELHVAALLCGVWCVVWCGVKI